MTIADGLMIGAVLLAPLVAVQVQKWLEEWKEKNERKEQIFKTLMATRARRLDHSHVEALNMIDLVFKGDPVCDKWTEYLDSLATAPEKPAVDASEEKQRNYNQDLKTWNAAHDDKFIDLLYEMSRALKYKFNKVHLKKSIYYPIAHSDIEIEQHVLRREALSFFSGIHAVKMDVTKIPTPSDQNEILKEQAKLRRYIMDLMEGKKSFPVSMSGPEERESK